MLKRDGREMSGSKPMNLSDTTDKWRRKFNSCKDCMADGRRKALYDKLYDGRGGSVECFNVFLERPRCIEAMTIGGDV